MKRNYSNLFENSSDFVNNMGQLFFETLGRVVFDDYPEDRTTTDNTNKCCLTMLSRQKRCISEKHCQ